MKPSTEQKLWMYETMCLIRHYEDSLAVAYFEGKLPRRSRRDWPSTSVPGRSPARCTSLPDRSRPQ